MEQIVDDTDMAPGFADNTDNGAVTGTNTGKGRALLRVVRGYMGLGIGGIAGDERVGWVVGMADLVVVVDMVVDL